MTSSPPTDPDTELLGYYRAEFERAKSEHTRIGLIQFGVTLLSAVAVIVPRETVTYGTTVAALLLGVAGVSLAAKLAQRKSAADRGRRALLLIKGLGFQLTGKERADILSCFDVPETEAQKLADPNYYDNAIPPGPRRLAVMVQESAHYSTHLYKLDAKATWTMVALTVILAIAILLFIPLLNSQKLLLLAAQLVCLGLTLLVTRDLVGKALGYQEAATTSAEVDHRLERLGPSELTEANVLFILEDYSAAVQSAPLISSSTYEKQKDRLARLWETRLDEGSGNATA